LHLYELALTRKPIYLPGIEALLINLACLNIPWGIVTNKPRRFSLPLVQAVPLMQSSLYVHAGSLVCGDDAPEAKPSPQTLLMACEEMQVSPEEVIYVGDAHRDVVAGNAAGMKTVVALFGYLSEEDEPDRWEADCLIKDAQALLPIVQASL